jgi:hypothetical protein
LDQREDDGCSLVFDSKPLREKMEVLGAPAVTFELCSDQPVAMIAVRLNDVAPGGASTRVTYGLLNLTHRTSHEHPEALEPGKRYVVTATLNDVAYAFPARHKLRLAVSTSYWPIAWPAPAPAMVSLFTGASFLDLPVRPSDPKDAELRPFDESECAAAETVELRPAPLKRIVEEDRTTDETIYTIASGRGDLEKMKLTRIKAIGLDVGHVMFRRFRIGKEDPNLAQAEVIQKTQFRRGTWKARVETCARMSSTETHFLLEAEIETYENDQPFCTRRWTRRIKRELL